MKRLFAHRRCMLHPALPAALCLLSCLPAFSQGASSLGQVSGVVSAPAGSPVAGAQVVLRAYSGSVEAKRAVTGKDGHYSFAGLLRGAYKLSAAASGYGDSATKIVILAAANASANLTLTPSSSTNSSSNSAETPPPPTFSTAGMHGSTAPSGYSTGLGEEETAQVQAGANSMAAPRLGASAQDAQIDCSNESELLRNVKIAPRTFAPNHALGAFYLNHGNYAQAIPYLSAAHTLAPADFNNTRDLAAAMIGGSRASEAVSLLEPLLSGHAPDAAFLKLLALAYKSSGRRDAAIAIYRKAAAVDASAANRYDCGLGLLQLGAAQPALDLFTSATENHPESARLWLGLGIAEQLLQHKQEAVSAWLRSADANPDFLSPLTFLAELSGLSNQQENGVHRRIAAYLAAHPQDASAHLAYARVLFRQNEQTANSNSTQKIAAELKRALQLNPKLARAHFMLGDLQARENQLADAIGHFVEGLKLEPENAEAHYRLSLLYRRNRQLEDARKEMNTFLALRRQQNSTGAAQSPGSIPIAPPPAQPAPCSK